MAQGKVQRQALLNTKMKLGAS